MYCYDADWGLRSFERLVNMVKNARAGKKGTAKTKPLHFVLCQTKSDVADHSVEGRKMAAKYNAQFVATSVKNNTGITECFEAAVVAINGPGYSFGEPTADPAPVPVPAVAPAAAKPVEKDELSSVWAKIVGKFLGGEKTPATKKADPAVAQVDDVARVA